jgi:hypothetical protein
MLFQNPWLLGGLVLAALPVIIHLVRRQAAKPLDWGAMAFLFDTVAARRRRMEWEDLLLMAARCLLLALGALAVARPFLSPDSPVPWMIVLPAGLLGIALAGASFVFEGKRQRMIARIAAGVLFAAAALLAVFEKVWNLRRFESGGRRDVALVLDASSSMELKRNGVRTFDAALEEARRIVAEAPRGTSFTIVLGGPAPQALAGSPLSHRADVLGLLEGLQPVGGPFRAHEALGMATLILSQGSNTSKEIVVLTDSQRSGWRLDEPSAWKSLQTAWKSLPAPPKLVVRDFGTPSPYRNISVSDVEMSRSIVGTDRELMIRATVTNAGSEALVPGKIRLEVEGEPVAESSVGLLSPGQKQVVEFSHRFKTRGAMAAAVTAEAQDDLPADNRAEAVINVRGGLPVLLVDGNASVSFPERGAGYMALALAPTPALMRGGGIGDGKKAEDFLMDPRVVAAAELRESDIAGASVIVLADVPRLPGNLARRISDRVASGVGLILIAGPRAEPEFYNAWVGSEGPLCPAQLLEMKTDPKGVSPAAATFAHESLARLEKGGDLPSAAVRVWWKTGEPVREAMVAAAFANGDGFLTTRPYGEGRVMMASCALDSRSGSLPARRSFVPLIHELVMWSTGGGVNLNSTSSSDPTVLVSASRGGLLGEYVMSRGGAGRKGAMVRRVDSTIDFDWGNGAPLPRQVPDDFAVVWKGNLLPPADGSYSFEGEADNELMMLVDGRELFTTDSLGKGSGRVTLEKGKAVSVELRYEEKYGPAFVRLYWTPPGGVRSIVPSMVLLPTGEGAMKEFEATDPHGKPRKALLRVGRNGTELAVEGAAVPGVYRIRAEGALAGFVDSGEKQAVPIAVARDGGESVFDPVTPTDIEMMRGHVDLLRPGSVADVLSVLQGKGFGRGIWKMVACAAFALLLLESALARWVSKARGAAESVEVEFGQVPAGGGRPA